MMTWRMTLTSLDDDGCEECTSRLRSTSPVFIDVVDDASNEDTCSFYLWM